MFDLSSVKTVRGNAQGNLKRIKDNGSWKMLYLNLPPSQMFLTPGNQVY